jgi:DNA processing protein
MAKTVSQESTLIDWLALHLAPGLGGLGLWRLIHHFGDPTAVLQAKTERLLTLPGIRKSQVAALSQVGELRANAERELHALRVLGGDAISFDDALYPQPLRQLSDPPPVLFLRGNKMLLHQPLVAIVGSRAATAYGRKAAHRLAEGLSRAGVIVVSGMAVGIDSSGHAGALQGGGTTIAVLGSGLDVVYPPQNKKLFQDIVARGVVISEYPLGTAPEAFRFPARNRIIAGITAAIVVVEAAKRSGSLITAQIGLDYGREIFAVPGQIDSFKSEGTHWLLQQGAKLVQRVEDILEELDGHWQLAGPDSFPTPDHDSSETAADSDEARLLSLLEPYPLPRDGVIAKVGLPAARVSELLLLLELAGKVDILPGDQIQRRED